MVTHTCYLAGPMSGYADHNMPMFDYYRDYLRTLGHLVLSPADLTRHTRMHYERDGHSTPEQYATFLRNDLHALLLATAIALMPGWEHSRGARFELHVAQMLGLQVLDATSGLRMIVPRVETTLEFGPTYEPIAAA